jgi:hypothetical protein
MYVFLFARSDTPFVIKKTGFAKLQRGRNREEKTDSFSKGPTLIKKESAVK